MDKDRLAQTQPSRAAFQKVAVRLGNGLQRLGMNGQSRAITGIGDAIRGKRGRTAYLGMQIGQVRAQTRILRKRVAHIRT